MEIHALARFSNDELAELDIAETNLRCALGLPDAKGLNISILLKRIDKWAAQIDHGIYSVRRRFKENPQLYNKSYDVFRIVMMATYIQKNLGVSYDRELVGLPTDDPSTWKPFTSSRNLFVHGPLLGYGGTCVSLPVLYCAIGRRLGFPLKLALANGHLYVRWETGREEDSFNIESTRDGLDLPPTSFYRSWPFKLEEGHLASNCFLRSLTPREELAVFITERGRCYIENLQFSDAICELVEAECLWPQNQMPTQMRWLCENGMLERRFAMQRACFTITT